MSKLIDSINYKIRIQKKKLKNYEEQAIERPDNNKNKHAKTLTKEAITEINNLINKKEENVIKLKIIKATLNDKAKRRDACYLSIDAWCVECNRVNEDYGKYFIRISANPFKIVDNDDETIIDIEYQKHKHEEIKDVIPSSEIDNSENNSEQMNEEDYLELNVQNKNNNKHVIELFKTKKIEQIKGEERDKVNIKKTFFFF